MFVIQNISHNELALGDLKLTLKPKQKIDLDRICPRHISDMSSRLKQAIGKGLIKVIEKDNIISSSSDKKNDDNIIVKEMREIEKRITDSLGRSRNSASSDPDSISLLIDKLNKIISVGELQKAQNQNKSEDVVDEKMVDIHTRSLNKMTSNIEGTINHNESTNQSDIADKVNELEGLL